MSDKHKHQLTAVLSPIFNQFAERVAEALADELGAGQGEPASPKSLLLSEEWLRKAAEQEVKHPCTTVGGLAVEAGLYKADGTATDEGVTQSFREAADMECEATLSRPVTPEPMLPPKPPMLWAKPRGYRQYWLIPGDGLWCGYGTNLRWRSLSITPDRYKSDPEALALYDKWLAEGR